MKENKKFMHCIIKLFFCLSNCASFKRGSYNDIKSTLYHEDDTIPQFVKEHILPVIDIINKGVNKCMRKESRSGQIREFSKIKCPENLFQIRLTQSSAVFGINIEDVNYVIKRYVSKEKTERKEDEICMRLIHENIIKTFYTFCTDNISLLGTKKDKITHWIVSEFLEVPVKYKTVNLNEDILRKICTDVLKGLDYLHKNGIAHLDLKMGNIMGQKKKDKATGHKEVVYKIIDFGFARECRENEEIRIPHKYYGTFPFAPPEIYFDGIYSQKADIWSLGAIVYHLSTEERIFYTKDGERDYKCYEKFLEGDQDFYFDKSVSQELINFVIRCMKIRRRDRPTASDLLKDPFIVNKIL